MTTFDEHKTQGAQPDHARSVALTRHEISETESKARPQPKLGTLLGWLIAVAFLLAFLAYLLF